MLRAELIRRPWEMTHGEIADLGFSFYLALHQNRLMRLRRADESDKYARLGFIRAKIDLGTTFANMAQSQHRRGHGEHAEKLFKDAQKAHREAMKWIDRASRLEIQVADEIEAARNLNHLISNLKIVILG